MLQNPLSAVGNPTSALGPSGLSFGPSNLAAVGILQARRQEMKWGGVCKKAENVGVFCTEVENGGCFFVKSGPFLNAGCIMYSISIFYFTFYLFGGYAPNAPPAYGL